MLTLDRAFAELEKEIRAELPFVQSVHFHQEYDMVKITATVSFPEWNGERFAVTVPMKVYDMQCYPFLYHDYVINPMGAMLAAKQQPIDEDMPDFEKS